MKKVFIATLVVAAVSLSGCSLWGNTDDTTMMDDQAVPVLQEKTDEQMESTEDQTQNAAESTMIDESMQNSEDAAVKVFELEGGSFYYKPNEIRVKKGQKVKVILKSVDMMHDFVIDELQVKMPIVKSGNTGEVEFTADTVGEFEFYCSVGQHRANGMVGTLVVTE